MPITIPAAATDALSGKNIRVRKVVEIFREYFNSDLRQSIDVTEYVAKWGNLSGVSTIKGVNWQIPALTLSMRNTDGYFAPFGPASVWAALATDFDKCVLRFRYLVPLPDGTSWTAHTYPGQIVDAVPRTDAGIDVVDIVTRHLIDAPLRAGITKQSGDETVVLGTLW